MADNQPDLSNVYTALRNADAAGDKAAAAQLSAYIRSVQSGMPAGGTSPSGTANVPSQTQGGKTPPSGTPTGGSDNFAPPKTLGTRAKEIGIQTGIGAAVGAFAPEILGGLAAASLAIPGVGEVAAPILGGLAASARAARLASAVYGAVGGAMGETAGQATEALGGTKGLADTARFVGGLAAPVGPGAVEAGAHGLGVIARTVRAAVSGAGDAAATSKLVRAAKSALAGSESAGVPQHLLHSVLNQGAEQDIKAASQQASKVYADSVERAAAIAKSDAASADKIIQQGRQQAAQIQADAAKRAAELAKLSEGRTATATAILKQADPALNRVGQPQELSDIGKVMQQAVTEKHGAALQARSEAYNTLKTQRDAIVQQKEAAGQSIDQTPAFQALKKEVQSTLKPTPSGFSQVIDPGVRRSFEALNEALTRDTISGVPGKTSFTALDQVRRRLGDVVANRDVEGYSAIGKDIAGRMYAQITKAQQEFAGPVQKELQSGYHEASQGLQKFGAGAAKKATAVDRMNPERLAADPQSIPGHFFNSQQSIKDFAELVQNPQLVRDTAHNYAARSVQGMDSKQVGTWMAKNSDWMREVPGLQKSLRDYQSQLEKIERVADKARLSAQVRQKQVGAVREGGEVAMQRELQASRESARAAAEGSVKTQERMLLQGEKAAEQTRQELQKAPAGLQQILQSGESAEAVRNLLMNGKPEQTRLAARYLANSPEGQKALDSSVRQILSTMNENQIRTKWAERILPMLREGKMMPPERLAALEKDVQRVMKAYSGPERLKWFQKHVISAMGTAGTGYFGGTGRGE